MSCTRVFTSYKRLAEKYKWKRDCERMSKKEIIPLTEKKLGDDKEISITDEISACTSVNCFDEKRNDVLFTVLPTIKHESYSNGSNSVMETLPETSSKNHRESFALHRQDSWASLDLSMNTNGNSKILSSHRRCRLSQSSGDIIINNNYSVVESSIKTDEDSIINHSFNNKESIEKEKRDEIASNEDFEIWLEEMEKFTSTLKSRGYSSNEVVKLCMSAHQMEDKVPKLPRTVMTLNRRKNQNARAYCRTA